MLEATVCHVECKVHREGNGDCDQNDFPYDDELYLVSIEIHIFI